MLKRFLLLVSHRRLSFLICRGFEGDMQLSFLDSVECQPLIQFLADAISWKLK